MLVDTANDWGRGILKGIHRYTQSHEAWHLFFDPSGPGDPGKLAPEWEGQGIIARVVNTEAALQLAQRKIPVINVSSIQYEGPQFYRVHNDVEGVARLAADYFRQRGFRAFAYLSFMGLEYVRRQHDAFVAAVKNSGGGSIHVRSVALAPRFQAADWNLNLDKLGEWLLTLPKPVALLTWSGGQEIIHACQKVGLHVPQEVALLSGSDDELIGCLAPIPISGVKVASERIGYEAAAQLDRLLRGGSPKLGSTLIAPLGVVTRQSTDTLAINDPKMRSVLNHIHANPIKAFQVSDLVRLAGLSRSGLERRFRTLLGIAPADYIARQRVERVKTLLAETALSVAAVAEQAGFSSPEYMTTVFRKQMRVTPLQYRRTLRS